METIIVTIIATIALSLNVVVLILQYKYFANQKRLDRLLKDKKIKTHQIKKDQK